MSDLAENICKQLVCNEGSLTCSMQKILGYNLDSIRGGREHEKIFCIFFYKLFLPCEHHFSSEPNEFPSCICLIPQSLKCNRTTSEGIIRA